MNILCLLGKQLEAQYLKENPGGKDAEKYAMLKLADLGYIDKGGLE